MKLNSRVLPLLLLLTALLNAQAQQPSFSVAGIKPFDKAAPGQIMEVLFEGLGSGPAPTILPATDFSVEVSQDGVTQSAKIGITKFSMVYNPKTDNSGKPTFEVGGMQMRAFHSVSFVVPKGLHPGPAEVVGSYKGKRGNAVTMEIIEKPLPPAVGGVSRLAVGTSLPDRPPTFGERTSDLGWKFERGATVNMFVQPLVDPDDPNSAVLVHFKQGNNDYEAVTRVKSTPAHVENRRSSVGMFAPREELEVEVPAALEPGKVQVEIRLKANGQVSEPVKMDAAITDVTRAVETPTAPRIMAVTPNRIGAGQMVLISVDQRRALEPSPQDTKVVIEQDNALYYAHIEKNSAVVGPTRRPDGPVMLFVRTTRQITGRVQVRVVNPARGEQTGASEPVSLEIVDEVLPPELIDARESTDADVAQLKELYQAQKDAGRDFPPYDPGRRYLTLRVQGIDLNPKFVRITLDQGAQKFKLVADDFSLYSADSLIVRLPQSLNGGDVKITIQNYGGDRYSTPVTKTIVLAAK